MRETRHKITPIIFFRLSTETGKMYLGYLEVNLVVIPEGGSDRREAFCSTSLWSTNYVYVPSHLRLSDRNKIFVHKICTKHIKKAKIYFPKFIRNTIKFMFKLEDITSSFLKFLVITSISSQAQYAF